jgi:superoxide dismutase, Cu-Zn family
MLRRSLSIIAALTLSPLLLDETAVPDTRRHAICILYPNFSNVRGLVSFSQADLLAPTNVTCVVRGLTPNGNHGIHIHEFGDLTEGCTTAGPHYNPLNTVHGGPFSEVRHVGDLGNLNADDKGEVNVCFSDKVISLYG